MIREIIKKFVIFFFCLLITEASAQNFKGSIQKLSISPPSDKLTIGETLTYSVEWLGIPAGKIILKVKGIENIDGHPCYHINAKALPNRWLRKFYDVEYRVDSYIDTKSLYTIRFEKVRRIKNIFTYAVAEFNQIKNEVTYRHYSPGGPIEIIEFPSLRKEIVANQTVTIKTLPSVQDLLSSLYYFRLLNIKEKSDYSINISYHSQNWPVKISVGSPFLKDIRKYGAFPVIELSPSSELNNFILGRRKILVYFTADSQRIPLLFTLNTALGIVRGVIQDHPE